MDRLIKFPEGDFITEMWWTMILRKLSSPKILCKRHCTWAFLPKISTVIHPLFMSESLTLCHCIPPTFPSKGDQPIVCSWGQSSRLESPCEWIPHWRDYFLCSTLITFSNPGPPSFQELNCRLFTLIIISLNSVSLVIQRIIFSTWLIFPILTKRIFILLHFWTEWSMCPRVLNSGQHQNWGFMVSEV